MIINRESKLLHWIILTALVIVWGSSFILMKKGLITFSSNEVGALRLSVTFIFLLPFLLFRFKKIKIHQFKYIALSGLIGNGIPAFLFAKAQSGIDSSLAGVLNSLTPLFTLLIGFMFFKYKTKWYNAIGVLIGLFGAAGLIYVNSGGSFKYNFIYSSYIILATLLYAINLNIIKKYLKNIDSLTIVCFAFFSIGIPSIVYLFTTDFIIHFQNNPYATKSMLSICILGVLGSGISGFVYNFLIKITNVLFAASVTYLMPIIAVLWGIIDGEEFGLIQFIWILTILFGVFLVNTNFSKNYFKTNYKKE